MWGCPYILDGHASTYSYFHLVIQRTSRSFVGAAALSAALATSSLGLSTTTAPPAHALGCATFSGGDGTSSATAFQIATAADLTTLQSTPTCWSSGIYFEQTADISMGSTTWTHGIGRTPSLSPSYFSGLYDGAGFSISDLTITSSDLHVGLFGALGGTVTNTHFVGSVTTTNTTSSGGPYIGGLVGYHAVSGSISQSSFSGSVECGDQSPSTPTCGVGGLIGLTARPVQNSKSSASVRVVDGKNVNAGGLIGRVVPGGSVSNSFSSGSILVSNSTSSLSHVGGLIGQADGNVDDSYSLSSVNNLSSTATNDRIGGLVGYNAQTLSGSYATGAVTSTGTGTQSIGGLVGANFGTVATATPSTWSTDATGQAHAWQGDTSYDGYGRTSAQMRVVTTFTGASINWSITSGYDASKTWGICSAVNDGYPFLTAFYSSDPCSGGGGGSTTTSSQPTYTFTFLTSGGGTCLADVTVTRFQRFTLPPASVACTPLGTSLVGWSIPGQGWAFTPERVVTVVDSQVFTAVAREPMLTVTYDANVNMGDECAANGANVDNEPDRIENVTIPRAGDAATLATSAPCTPPGFTLIGWTNANTPDGSGQAQPAAQTYAPGSAVPEIWNLEDPNPVNTPRLYALWGRSDR